MKRLIILIGVLIPLSMPAQSDPVANYIANYFEMLNNLGDASMPLSDRKLFQEEILSQYFLFEGALVWNHLRPDGKQYIKPREYLDNILTDFPKGITFDHQLLNVGSLQPFENQLKSVVQVKVTARSESRAVGTDELRMVLIVRQFNPSSLSARISSIDQAEGAPPPATETRERPTPPLQATQQHPPVPDRSLPEPIRELALNMVRVSGGSFLMGCTSVQEGSCNDDEKPLHQITLNAFSISKYEVTQAQWEVVMGTTIADQRDKRNIKYPLRGEGPNYPMYYVSWEDAQLFIRKLNQLTGGQYRLPTEAEWEYAAAGGSLTHGYRYAGGDKLESVGWLGGNSGGATNPVGSKLPNELDLYDMSGNVWEWCADWYSADYYAGSPAQNPGGAPGGKYRVRRGGSWSDDDRSCRVTNRRSSKPNARYGNLGFRLVAP